MAEGLKSLTKFECVRTCQAKPTKIQTRIVHVVTALLLKAPTGEGIDAGFGEAGTEICSRGRALKPPKPFGFYRSNLGTITQLPPVLFCMIIA